MGAFDNRVGRQGYDSYGWAEPGSGGSAARENERKMVNEQMLIIRQSQKNARNALRNGDMEAWQKWNTASGGSLGNAPNTDTIRKIAEGIVYRNLNDAANLRPAGAPPNDQPVADQPNAQAPQAGNADAPNAPAKQPEAGGVNAPAVDVKAPETTTEKSTREALSIVSKENPYGLPSVERENARRAELADQGAFGTKSAKFEEFQNRNKPANDAAALIKSYEKGEITAEQFDKLGAEIKGATPENIEKARIQTDRRIENERLVKEFDQPLKEFGGMSPEEVNQRIRDQQGPSFGDEFLSTQEKADAEKKRKDDIILGPMREARAKEEAADAAKKAEEVAKNALRNKDGQTFDEFISSENYSKVDYLGGEADQKLAAQLNFERNAINEIPANKRTEEQNKKLKDIDSKLDSTGSIKEQLRGTKEEQDAYFKNSQDMYKQTQELIRSQGPDRFGNLRGQDKIKYEQEKAARQLKSEQDYYSATTGLPRVRSDKYTDEQLLNKAASDIAWKAAEDRIADQKVRAKADRDKLNQKSDFALTSIWLK